MTEALFIASRRLRPGAVVHADIAATSRRPTYIVLIGKTHSGRDYVGVHDIYLESLDECITLLVRLASLNIQIGKLDVPGDIDITIHEQIARCGARFKGDKR